MTEVTQTVSPCYLLQPLRVIVDVILCPRPGHVPSSQERHVTTEAVACPAVGRETSGSSRGQLLAVKPVLTRSQADREGRGSESQL